MFVSLIQITNNYHFDILFQSSCSENSQNISKSVDSTLSTKSKNKRSSHGTISNITSDKVALENQWLRAVDISSGLQ